MQSKDVRKGTKNAQQHTVEPEAGSPNIEDEKLTVYSKKAIFDLLDEKFDEFEERLFGKISKSK